MIKIGKYSFGTGDRFGRQGNAQLRAIMEAEELGVEITPVWNKSHREHTIVGTSPADTRKEADLAVRALGWEKPYFVDADHINLDNVDLFLPWSDFFTMDVANAIGKPVSSEETEAFVADNATPSGIITLPGMDKPVPADENYLRRFAGQYLHAINEAKRIYDHIASQKDPDSFVVEVSMDEVDSPQSPADLYFILKLLAEKNIPVQTIAPRFSGRFNKGVDYVGDLKKFEQEFEQDLMVLSYARASFGLPDNLKLSIHSGSDKFSIYPVMGRLIRKYDQGIHVKTAGTTWLEELIGLALSGPEPLDMVKAFYADGLRRMEELTAPYAEVIDIDRAALPDAGEFAQWSGEKVAAALRHVPGNTGFNPHIRQLMHVAYKLAAEKGKDYLELVEKNEEIIGAQVKENLLERHIKRLFL
jgi:hypothetical protein